MLTKHMAITHWAHQRAAIAVVGLYAPIIATLWSDIHASQRSSDLINAYTSIAMAACLMQCNCWTPRILAFIDHDAVGAWIGCKAHRFCAQIVKMTNDWSNIGYQKRKISRIQTVQMTRTLQPSVLRVTPTKCQPTFGPAAAPKCGRLLHLNSASFAHSYGQSKLLLCF